MSDDQLRSVLKGGDGTLPRIDVDAVIRRSRRRRLPARLAIGATGALAAAAIVVPLSLTALGGGVVRDAASAPEAAGDPGTAENATPPSKDGDPDVPGPVDGAFRPSFSPACADAPLETPAPQSGLVASLLPVPQPSGAEPWTLAGVEIRNVGDRTIRGSLGWTLVYVCRGDAVARILFYSPGPDTDLGVDLAPGGSLTLSGAMEPGESFAASDGLIPDDPGYALRVYAVFFPEGSDKDSGDDWRGITGPAVLID